MGKPSVFLFCFVFVFVFVLFCFVFVFVLFCFFGDRGVREKGPHFVEKVYGANNSGDSLITAHNWQK